ncbi:unnamed protein product [Oikopleura dioica]|uniref:Uncharacterized protein n=1 Tax=Oikopleura dioica TaxID=34765 RepID=E4Z1T8_OIKDI|nr:unnamed protein product [Oikopleura dioica]
MNNQSIEYSAFEKNITKEKRRSSSPIPSRIRLSPPTRVSAPLAVAVAPAHPKRKRSAVTKILNSLRKKLKRKNSAASIEFSYAERSLSCAELKGRIERTRLERMELQRKLFAMETKSKPRAQLCRRSDSIIDALKQKELIQKRLKRRSHEPMQCYHVAATIQLNA